MASIGKKLGRYELIAESGGGRWLARQQGVDKRVEIRILSGADAEAQLTHAREIAQIEHTNLARVLDLGEDGGDRYVVTESLDGVTLAEILASDKRLDELGIARVLADAAEGVDAAHEHADGLVHGGVSPATIGVGFSGQVKLSALDITAPGSLAYCAPERLDGSAGDARSDVFSLGVVLWEALTRERLFDGSTDDATRRMVRELQIESPAMLNANIPAPLADTCMKALAADPAVRYPSAKQFAVELEAVLTQAGYSRRNDLVAKYVGDAFAERAAARKKKASVQPDTAPVVVPVIAPVVAPVGAPIAPIAPVIPSIRAASPSKPPLTQTMTMPMPSVVPAPAKALSQTMVMPSLTVRPATASTPPVTVPAASAPAAPAMTLKMPPAMQPVVEPVAAPVPEPSPAVTAAETIAPAAAATAALEPAVDPAAAVSLPERPSMDVIGGWGWATDSVPAIGANGEELDEPPPPTNRKALMFVFGGAVALAALISIVALASGGSSDDDAGKKKPAVVAKAIEPAAPVVTPIPAATVLDDAAVADPALTAPQIDAAPLPPDPPPPPPIDAAPPPPMDAPPPPDAAVPKPPPPVPLAIKPPVDKPRPPVDKPKPPVVALTDKPKPPADKPKPPKGPTTNTTPKPVDPYATPDFDPAAANRSGLQQFARGDTAGALATLRGSLASSPSYAPTWRSLGLIFQKLGERDQARAAFKRYLQLAPGADDAEQIRGRLEQLGA